MKFIHDITGARINASPVGSGTALIAVILYQLMFYATRPYHDVSYHRRRPDQAHRKTDGCSGRRGRTADETLAKIKSEAEQLVKLSIRSIGSRYRGLYSNRFPGSCTQERLSQTYYA